jgi:hypothetical protein
MIINDGTGTGSKLRISRQNRAQTDAVTHSSAQQAAEEGRLYQIGAGIVNLTSANESQVLFLKNEGDKDLEIVNVTISSGLSTGGAAGDVLLAQLYSNPDSITGTDAPFVNNNLGSSRSPEGVFTAGAEGSTITGGTLGGAVYLPVAQFQRVELYWVLPKGASLAISITPPAGNTNLNVGCFVDIYESNEDL